MKFIAIILLLVFMSCNNLGTYRVQYLNGVKAIEELPYGFESGDTIMLHIKSGSPGGDGVIYHDEPVIILNKIDNRVKLYD